MSAEISLLSAGDVAGLRAGPMLRNASSRASLLRSGTASSSWMNQRLKHCPCRHGLFDLTYFDIQWGIETTLCTVVEAGGIALSTYSSSLYALLQWNRKPMGQ
jgi:hypothetical protein